MRLALVGAVLVGSLYSWAIAIERIAYIPELWWINKISLRIYDSLERATEIVLKLGIIVAIVVALIAGRTWFYAYPREVVIFIRAIGWVALVVVAVSLTRFLRRHYSSSSSPVQR